MSDVKRRKLDDNGCEVLDDTPVAMPVRFGRAENLSETVRRLVAGELSGYAASQGFESFDEADDFEVGDDYDPRSRYELDDVQSEYDIRYDDRYKRRPPAAQGASGEGVKQNSDPVRIGGKDDAGATEGVGSDQRSAGGNAD